MLLCYKEPECKKRRPIWQAPSAGWGGVRLLASQLCRSALYEIAILCLWVSHLGSFSGLGRETRPFTPCTTAFCNLPNGQQKKQQIFFKTDCFHCPPVGGWYSVWNIVRGGACMRPSSCRPLHRLALRSLQSMGISFSGILVCPYVHFHFNLIKCFPIGTPCMVFHCPSNLKSYFNLFMDLKAIELVLHCK